MELCSDLTRLLSDIRCDSLTSLIHSSVSLADHRRTSSLKCKPVFLTLPVCWFVGFHLQEILEPVVFVTG